MPRRKTCAQTLCLGRLLLGDLAAVERGRVRNITKEQNRAKFREPDRLGNPYQELKRLVKNYQKVAGARSIGPHLNPELNRSTSFLNFIRGVRGLLAQEERGPAHSATRAT